jgi:exosome complex component RRP4
VRGKTYASVLGFVQRRPPVVRIVPLSGRYIPKPGDTVVGTVTDVQGTFWLLDIGAPRWAPLHMTGTPWTIEFGETDQYLRVRDSVVVQVESLEATGRIGVTMNGPGLGKLEGGTIVPISPARVPRVIGREGSMIQTLTRHTGAKIVVGQNGRVWVGGSDEAIQRVQECLQLIDEEGQRSGLTGRVESLLRATGDPPPGEDGPRGRGVPPRNEVGGPGAPPGAWN